MLYCHMCTRVPVYIECLPGKLEIVGTNPIQGSSAQSFFRYFIFGVTVRAQYVMCVYTTHACMGVYISTFM